MNQLRLLLTSLATGCLLGSCGEATRGRAPVSSTSTTINISLPDEGWAGSVDYRNDESGVPVLTLDGVRFELRDRAAYILDWEAIGMSGIIEASSVSYESTTPVEGALLAVAGKPVELRAGILMWGGDEVGPVDAGDTVVVDADGLTIQAD